MNNNLFSEQLWNLVSGAINIRFYASSNSVGVYEHFELFWEVKGAEEVSIQPLLGRVPAKGSKVLSAEQSIEFQLTASNWIQSLSRVTSVMVDPKPYFEYLLLAINDDPSKNVVLGANPDYPDQFGIVQGQVLQLGWRAINTTELKLDGASVPTTDSIVLAPKGLNVFSFSATGKYGTLSKTIIVNALAPNELGPVSLTIPTAVAADTIADLPPILSKILIPAGSYDKAIQVQERSFAAVQDQFLHQQTEQNNQQTNLQEQQQQQLEVEQQLERNREILRMIAGAQIQLVRDQVNRWMENERDKLKKG